MADIGVLFRAAMVSALPTVKFHPGEAPAGVDAPTPYGVYTYWGEMNTTLQGRSDQQAVQLQVDVYAPTYLAANSTALQVVAAAELHSVHASPPTFSAMPVAHEYMGVDRDVKLHRVRVEFHATYYP